MLVASKPLPDWLKAMTLVIAFRTHEHFASTTSQVNKYHIRKNWNLLHVLQLVLRQHRLPFHVTVTKRWRYNSRHTELLKNKNNNNNKEKTKNENKQTKKPQEQQQKKKKNTTTKKQQQKTHV